MGVTNLPSPAGAGLTSIKTPGARSPEVVVRQTVQPAIADSIRFAADCTTSKKTTQTRNTGIVATLGPASSSPKKIRALAEAGVNVFRLNFSHGVQKDHGERIKIIRKTSEELLAAGKISKPLQILADIQGPKIRVGALKPAHFKPDGINTNPYFKLEPGQTVYLSNAASSADPSTIPVTFPEMIGSLQAGQTVLLDDGKIEFKVEEAARNGRVKCTVVRDGDGKLYSNKGINLPNVDLKIPSLSEKDKKDIAFAVKKGVDCIAVSFVRTPKDMQAARDFVGKLVGSQGIQLVSKIEKPEAVRPENLPGIVALSDWVMVARGDLGIETDPVDVPCLQERIIEEARGQDKPVIVATQMLESMLHSKMPSRADVSDIADAVKDGANFVMLSGETAVGDYPVEAVQQMDRIICRYEPDRGFFFTVRRFLSELKTQFLNLFKRLKKLIFGVDN